ncbi:hypothetical protein D5039_00035 [Verminephrobacter aporrectodeae subsp. tuberculatae]|uniref:Uncharacterized protein n=1 Tax=Verminephrobacter aporrectodeae subsp. tuberculatae TaxID=1110392 RepID=A0ABT3KMS4_9BURK|nr:hypothetical protein [Verminephrobacter aporrectodeae]MCW5319623.1 hypothetical protein [Verminephrobacter aporrectodeae subsp. tuberculatae]
MKIENESPAVPVDDGALEPVPGETQPDADDKAQLQIENGALVAVVDGVEETVQLPRVAANAKVKVWVVPTEYRDNGLFVAVTLDGSHEEVPACDPAATSYLGEIELDADDKARLKTLKDAKRAEINAACEATIAAMVAAYPEHEVQSWPQQVKEAEALAANKKAVVPLLASIAEARSIPVDKLASVVLAKMGAFAAMSGERIGRRHALEKMIDDAVFEEDVADVVWEGSRP